MPSSIFERMELKNTVIPLFDGLRNNCILVDYFISWFLKSVLFFWFIKFFKLFFQLKTVQIFHY